MFQTVYTAVTRDVAVFSAESVEICFKPNTVCGILDIYSWHY